MPSALRAPAPVNQGVRLHSIASKGHCSQVDDELYWVEYEALDRELSTNFIPLPMFRSLLLIVAILSGILNLVGCMHRQLNENEKYVETFESFYLTADQKQIAIVGKRYHYVFNAPAEVLNALKSDLHPIMDAAFLGFSVAVDQNIKGTYKIYIDTVESRAKLSH